MNCLRKITYSNKIKTNTEREAKDLLFRDKLFFWGPKEKNSRFHDQPCGKWFPSADIPAEQDFL